MSAEERPRRARVETLVRRSRLLDGVSKRRWLAVLPYLTPSDRDRLTRILEGGGIPLDFPGLDRR